MTTRGAVESWIAAAPYFQSLLRIAAALLFIPTGTMKLFAFPVGIPPHGGTVELFSQMGLGGILEAFGGALILIGLFTRPVAFVLSGMMAVAYFQFHFPQNFWPVISGGTPAALFCFVWLYFSSAGAGPWSLDAMRERNRTTAHPRFSVHLGFMITLLSALLISANAAAAPPDHPPEVREFLDIVNPPLVLKVPGAEKVKVKRDVPYKSVDGTPLLADIYSPPTRSGAPVVVLIHGGMGPAFPVRPKDWGMYQSWGRTLAASGFVTIAFNHRLGFPEPRLREASSDLRDLIGHIRSHAAELNADPERIALVAFSAGGPLLAPAMQTRPPYIRCLVSYYNFLDITRTIHHSQFESPETVREFSPVTHLAPDNPPMLVVRAGRDAIPALNESIATFVARAVEVNAPLTLMIHPTAPHGFENKQDDARTREILSSTVEFLKRHLDAPK